MEIKNRYYNFEEVRAYFRISRSTLRRLIDDGELKKIVLRKQCVRISADEIKKLEKRLKVDVFE
jgi:excisionase family DNA binding protein